MTLPAGREEFSVRAAAETDAAVYRELRLESLRDFPAAFSSDYAENADKPPEFWSAAVQPNQGEKSALIFLAFRGAEPAGTCCVLIPKRSKQRHSVTIVGMYVRPAWRGRGLADRLMEACLDAAKKEGATIAKLFVEAGNASAIRCYFRCGFHVYGTEPSAVYWNGKYYDDLLMYKFL